MCDLCFSSSWFRNKVIFLRDTLYFIVVVFLLQSEKQLRNEIGMRHEILIAFEEQKSLIDALTTVINFLFSILTFSLGY